jgi:hypothetical protein
MTEHELRELLRNARLDLDPRSEERAWQVVRGSYQSLPARRVHWNPRRAIGAVACIALAATLALATVDAPRQAVAHWFRDTFGLSPQPHAAPMRGGLPGGGRLLVETSSGPWLVAADGTRSYLGGYTGAAWSPHSRYVVVWRGTELAALNLAGVPQWELTAPGAISAARWSPDGYRIAFLADGGLHVVAGDSTGEHTLRAVAAPVPPAWQPQTGNAHRLTFVTPSGAVEQIDADSGAALWRAHSPAPVRRLVWSPDGRRLLVLGAHELAEYTTAGRLITTVTPSPAATIGNAAFISAERFALIIRPPLGRPDSIEVLNTGTHPAPAVLYTGIEQLSDLDASPGHQWLLAASRSADQWIFIRVSAPAKLLATSGITAEFQRHTKARAGYPRLAGWQH